MEKHLVKAGSWLEKEGVSAFEKNEYVGNSWSGIPSYRNFIQ